MRITRECAEAFIRCRRCFVAVARTHDDVTIQLETGREDLTYMLEHGAISAEEADQARRELLQVASARRYELDIAVWEVAA